MATKKQTTKDKKLSRKTVTSRKFLNKDSGMAAIQTRFDFNPQWIYAGGWEATVSLTDCSRSINLDFSAFSEKDIDKALGKISLLLTEFEKLGNLMLEYREAAQEHIKKAVEERKRRKARKTTTSLLDKLNDDE